LMSALERRPWHEIDVDEWDRVMAVNLRGMFLCCQAVYPQMKEQQSGKIINISSSRFWLGTPMRLHYSTSKAGVIGLTRSLAREVGDDNIAVNAITRGLPKAKHNSLRRQPIIWQYLKSVIKAGLSSAPNYREIWSEPSCSWRQMPVILSPGRPSMSMAANRCVN